MHDNDVSSSDHPNDGGTDEQKEESWINSGWMMGIQLIFVLVFDDILVW